MSGNRVLVTGAGGMIGTALAERLQEEGDEVVGVDVDFNRWADQAIEETIECDLTDQDALSALPHDVDVVVHFAANARVHKLVQQPELARDNFDMTFNVLEYMRKAGVSKLVFGSSREIYGNKDKIIYSEEDTFVDECESPYTASKVGGESMINAYEQCYGFDAAILRFSNVYGRYDLSDRVIPLFISQTYRGEDLTVFGADKVLDFTYLDDCVDGVARVIQEFNKAGGTTFNIASGEGSSLIELAERITELVDRETQVSVGQNRTGEVSRYVADISKAQKILGYEPTYDLRTGLEETVDWYLAHEQLLESISAS